MEASFADARHRVQIYRDDGWTPSEIIAHTGYKRGFVSKWYNRESTEVSPRSGRPKKLSTAVRKTIVRHLTLSAKTHSSQSLRAVAQKVGLSKDSVRNARIASGLKPYLKKLEPMHRKITPAKRLKFATNRRNADWSKYVFVDEKKFQLYALGNRHNDVVYVFDKEDVPVQVQVAHPPKVNVWAGMSAKGTVGIEIFEENMNAEKYKTILKTTMLPAAKKLYPNKKFTVLQDGDPKHRAKIVQQWFADEKIDVIPPSEWPGYSPDLNPIENLWAILQERVRKREPKTVEALKKAIRDEWKKIDIPLLENLALSMSQRLKTVRRLKGGYTGY